MVRITEWAVDVVFIVATGFDKPMFLKLFDNDLVFSIILLSPIQVSISVEYVFCKFSIPFIDLSNFCIKWQT